jgi:hypothetical protein
MTDVAVYCIHTQSMLLRPDVLSATGHWAFRPYSLDVTITCNNVTHHIGH